MAGELAGKVAVVTGGASGIGRATVELFVDEGAKVVIGDVDRAAGEQLASTLAPNAAFCPADVSDADQVQALVDHAVARFGGLHVMFNNAGISSSLARFLRDDLADFDRVMRVNLFGVMAGTQRAARHMAEHGGGAIINNASLAGLKPTAGVVVYGASKAAIVHFTKSAAIDLAEHGIRVNCVAPAHIATAITSYDMGPVITLTQPLQRQGHPEDVAQAVLYLASARAAQVTGVVIPVDGGTAAGAPPAAVRKALGQGRGEG
ncbi:MAG TPA: SDR family oxidoreductase [Acidimicrobiales bacterium]|nr:SDR family oxidoreductase [Acidimicrobiales bacterium]